MIEKFHWPFERFWSSHNALTLRRGFKVFTRSCNTCHAVVFCTDDCLTKKAFGQNELGAIIEATAPFQPGHRYMKGHFVQEWTEQ